nr:retrovirus-related Pol polyprotein from transposon TNT 1-94 [Tanacetum cinerariifolium]
MQSSDLIDTLMVDKSKLDKDLQGKPVDPTYYHGMIGSHMYLTSNRPDLIFSLFMFAWYEAKPTEKHLHTVKRIFQYLKGTSDMGLWYSKDSCFTLTAYADADHAGVKILDEAQLEKIKPESKVVSKPIGSQRSEDVRSCPIPDRLKFITKGEIHQVYGKSIPEMLITDEIKISEAYKIFISLSTGLIPPKIGRGKGAQGTKATVASKKKLAKKNKSSNEESDEQEERIIRRKPQGVVIQDTLPYLEIDTQKAIKAIKRKSRFQHQSSGLSEGAGITPKVPDEPTRKSVVLNEGAGISLEVSTNEDKDDDESIDIENTDDERTESKNDDHALTDAFKIDAAQANQVPKFEAFNDVLQRVYDLEKDVKEVKQVDHTPAILESIKSHVPSAVDKYLRSSMGDTLQKILFKKKRRHEDKDQDPTAGSDQWMKKRRTRKDAEPSMKSLKSKESAKGKTSSNTSKTGKYVFANKLVHEPEHVVQIDVKEPNLDNVANDADEPQADAITKIPKKDWMLLLEYLIGGPQRQQYYRSMINWVSKHKVFSTMRILSIVSVKIKKKSGYGYLEEFVVRVEDVQLGVKGYQRKVNLTKPQRKCPHISVKEPYTPKFDPSGVIYEDKSKKKRLMRCRTSDLVNKDMPLREWTVKDKRRTCIMLNKIDDQLFKRRIMRSLEVLVGGRKTEMD